MHKHLLWKSEETESRLFSVVFSEKEYRGHKLKKRTIILNIEKKFHYKPSFYGKVAKC